MVGMTSNEIAPQPRIAAFVSDVFSPPTLMLPIAMVAARWAGGGSAWAYAALYLSLSVVAPMADLAYRFRRGDISDIHLPYRSERMRPFVINTAGTATSLLLLHAFGAPAILVAVAAGGLLQSTVLMAMTAYWQVSVHAAASASLATFVTLAHGLGVSAVMAGAVFVAVGWSRVRLNRHTGAQVAVGAIVGALAIAAALAGVR